MSSPSTLIDEQVTEVPGADATTLGRRLLATPLRFVGFWAAVVMPFLYLPLLLGGLAAGETTVFVGLLLVHVAALVVGHEHGR
jgi:predicted thioesterase